MDSKLLRVRLLASTVFVSAIAMSTAAVAQDNQTAPAGAISGDTNNVATARSTSSDGSQGGEIIVTGSRIPQPNLTSASPVAVINSQELKLQGTTRVEDVLNSLPQLTGAQGNTVNNGSDGTASLDLRNLGPVRTLVLVDGRRVVPGDPNPKGTTPQNSVADINLIPGIMIKRVDVLTGGASAVYGADAVAGVVNFIMDTNFKGFSVDGQYSLYAHNNANKLARVPAAAGDPYPQGDTYDGRDRDIQAKFGAGTDDGRGNVVAYLGYRKTAPVLQGARDYSACTLQEKPAGEICGGSATSYPGSFYNFVDAAPVTVGPNSSFVTPVPTYNYGPLNYLQRSDKRYTAGFFAHYDVSDAFKPYAEFMFQDDVTTERDAPGGNFNDAVTQTDRVNCDNPELGASQVAFLCQAGNLVTNADGTPFTTTNPVTGAASTYGNVLAYRRNVEGGSRYETYRHQEFRAVVGAKGDIAKGVSYDAYFLYGQTDFFEKQTGYFQGTHINNALDVITGPNGAPECRSVANGSDLNCVPYNIFALGGVTQAAVNYLEVSSLYQGTNTEKVASGSFTFVGDEYGLKSPFADHGIGINVGAEYRSESLSFNVDGITSAGDISGGAGVVPNVSGGFDVKEGFAEIQIPLVSDKPFMHELTLDGGIRYSSYSLQGNTTTYKAQAVWAPIRQVTFRGGYNRAVRAPNIGELFNPATIGLTDGADPCEGATPTDTVAQCVNLGVPANRYGTVAATPSGQYNELQGGNPALKPEVADTYTLGAVVQPLHNLSFTVDAYKIKVKGTISQIGFSPILSTCATTAQLCNLVHRDGNLTLWQTPNGYVADTLLNFGTTTTQGIDATADYLYHTSKYGSIGLSGQVTYVDKLKVNEPQVITYDCRGYYGPTCENITPKFRAKTRLTWTTPWNVAASLQWRYIGGSKLESLSSQLALKDVADYPYADKIKAYNYFDLVFTARASNILSLRIGANNITDKDPPIFGTVYAPAGNGNTFSQQYDALGRYVFVGASLDF